MWGSAEPGFLTKVAKATVFAPVASRTDLRHIPPAQTEENMKHFALPALMAGVVLSACGDARSDQADVIDSAAQLTDEVTGTGDAASGLVLGFEIYPGADVKTNMSAMGGSMVLFSTADSADDVIAFYREAGEAKGFALEESQPLDNQRVLRGKTPEEAELILTVTREDGTTTGDMSIREGG